MVFTTAINFIRARGPDEIWRKRRILKLAAHYVGRRRNCYSIAVRSVHRALVYVTKGRHLKKTDMINLWDTRVTAACNQHNIEYGTFREALSRCDIMLNRKCLADLAIWEPHSFKALADVAKRRGIDDGLRGIVKEHEVDRVITRGTVRSK
ncbi:39S ribosomal protein L20, mitochondrial [Anthonomus grandis grandis]|uniref:39S ribosomal protein L20, mitochondrial n=1 Tax=Anthonomus grandis grandis TaxID=2921223 RepID=UPI0021651AAB|nr:39S ribosomal protein L20, mitochondrial [Anthonomus grandis grandis]